MRSAINERHVFRINYHWQRQTVSSDEESSALDITYQAKSHRVERKGKGTLNNQIRKTRIAIFGYFKTPNKKDEHS